MKLFALIISFFLLIQVSYGQSLILNEISQGPSGTKEYIELLVTGPPQTDCSVTPPCMDLRNWILDDNNGYLNGASVSGVGIAPGACRFSNDIFWSCIPAGTIIAIYNDADPNAAFGPDDASMSDGNCALVLPISSTLFERHTTQPSTTSMNYSTTGWVAGGSWSHISLSNGEDGFQIYDPSNLLTPVFSIGWGPSNNLGDIYMGSSSSSDDVFYLTDCNPYNQASWAQGCAGDPSCGNDDQTPGIINPGQVTCIGQMNHNCNPPALNIISTNETCLGDCDGTIDVSVTGGTAPFVYSWSPAPGTGQGTNQVSNLCPGTYTLTFTNDNGNGCTQIETIDILAGPNCTNPCSIDGITANFSSCDPFDNTYDANGTVSVTNPPLTGTLTITVDDGVNPVYDTIINAPFVSPIPWSISNMVTGTGSNATINASFSDDPTCFLDISQAVPQSCPCQADAGTYAVNQSGQGTNNFVLCFGDQINFVHNQDEVLSPDYSHPTINYQPDIAWVLYSCLPSAGIEPNNDPCFVGIIGSGYTFSDLNDLSLISAYPPSTFTNNTVYIAPITMYDNSSGAYTAYSNPNDCYNLGSVTTVTYLNDLSFSISEDCLNGTALINLTGGYSEFFGGNIVASNLAPNNLSFTNTTTSHGGSIEINGLSDGDNYSFTIVDPNGCSIIISGGPYSGQADASIISTGPFCPNSNSEFLTALSPGGTWSGNAILDPVTGEINPSLLGPGTYQVSYNIPGVCGDQSDTTIIISAPPTVLAPNNASICIGQSVSLNANGQSNNGILTYTWIDTAGNIVGNGQQIQVNPTDTTTYIIQATDACGISISDTVEIFVIESPQVSFTYSDSSGCSPLEVEFVNTSSPASTNCYWVIGSDTLNNSCDTIQYTFTEEGCFDISLYTSFNSCSNTLTIPNLICVHPDAEAGFTISPDSASTFDPLVEFYNSSSNASAYNWFFGSSDSSDLVNPVFSYPGIAGNYPVCLTALSPFGCHDTLCDTVTIYDEFLLYVPNAFRPNSDGLNDFFGPVISDFNGTYEFIVFDRWGQIVFESESPNEHWDGSYKNLGELAKSDVYTWYIRLQFEGTTDIREYHGHVSLLR